MLAMRLREAGDDWLQLVEPTWQPLLQHPLPRAPCAGDDDQRAIATRVRGLQEAHDRCAAGFLRMAMQIDRAIDLQLAPPHTLLTAAISQWSVRLLRYWLLQAGISAPP